MSEGEVQLRLGENAATPESFTICKCEILDIFDETSGHFAKQWKLHLKKCEVAT